MAVKIYKNKIVIKDFQHYWKEDSKTGHIIKLAHGKTDKDTIPFVIELNHSDKIRTSDGRWRKIKK